MRHVLATVVVPREPSPENNCLMSREAKNLSYKAEVPSFLQQLHSQVYGSHSIASCARYHEEDKDQDPVLTSLGRSGDKAKADQHTPAPSGNGYDNDNDLEHAQVVVVKEGKHLTKEEAMEATNQSNKPSTDSKAFATRPEKVAEAHLGLPKSRGTTESRQRSPTMIHAKRLIHAHRDQKRMPEDTKPIAPKRQRKTKLGSGLSFDIEDA